MMGLTRCHECDYWDPDRELAPDGYTPADRATVRFGLCRANPPAETVTASEKVIDYYEVNRLVRLAALPEELRDPLNAWWVEFRKTLLAVPREFKRGSWPATHRMDGCGKGRRIVDGTLKVTTNFSV